MKITAWIPNLFTLANLVCGFLAIQYANDHLFIASAILVLGGALFDFLDGMVARLLKVSSELGKQLDSLSDVVTFGVAPGMIMWNLLHTLSNSEASILPYVALCIPVFSAVRLAIFNLDTEQSDQFMGLPTPANGLFFAFLPLFLYMPWSYPEDTLLTWVVMPALPQSVYELILQPWFHAVCIVLFSLLMVSRIPLFSLKVKSLGWRSNELRWVFLFSALSLLIIFHLKAIPFIVLLYVCLSLIVLAFDRK